MRDLILIAHDIRSTHNVGSLLRTAEGLGVTRVYLTGYTPYPVTANDTRLPHIAAKLSTAIQKTALNAQNSQDWEHEEDVFTVLLDLKANGYTICALEQTDIAIPLISYDAPQKCAVLLGSEVTGVNDDLLRASDAHVVIPMYGKKESFNVVQAAAMALYELTFH